MPTMTCPKCSVQLQEGFLLERARHGRGATEWIEGRPVASFWTGLDLRGRARLPVASFRCPRCGLLELHAPASSSGGG
jgi:hypothetical protein